MSNNETIFGIPLVLTANSTRLRILNNLPPVLTNQKPHLNPRQVYDEEKTEVKDRKVNEIGDDENKE